MVSRLRAFTLIELMVVMLIIVLVMGFLLAGIPMLKENARKAKARQICSLVAGGLVQSGRPGVARHPFAGTAAPRALFIRGRTEAGIWSKGDAVDAAAIMLRPSRLSSIPKSQTASIVDAEDRFAEPQQQSWYGVRRGDMGVIGVDSQLIMRHLRIPDPGLNIVLPKIDATTHPLSKFGEPDLLGYYVKASPVYAIYSDADLRDQNADNRGCLELRAEEQFQRALPNLDEIVAAGAVVKPDIEKDALAVLPDWVKDRVRISANSPSSTEWTPFSVGASGDWRLYVLRGPSLRDPWGGELAIGLDAKGSLRIESAGKDGMFRFDPGPDGVYQTTAADDAPQGDDILAAEDNQGYNIGVTP